MPTDLGELSRIRMGRNVALGGGRWSYAETRALGGQLSWRTVRTLEVAAAMSDCDGNGTSDLSEVLAGAGDCDLDGIPDACTLAADCDSDDVPDACSVLWQGGGGTSGTPWSGGWFPGDMNTYAFMWLVPATVPLGSDGVLRGIEADWITVYQDEWNPPPSASVPQPTLVAVYDDPNQDGNPADAVFRAAFSVTPSVAGGLDRVIIDPITIGMSGTRYFIGAGIVRIGGTPNSLFLRLAEVSAEPSPPAWLMYADTGLYADLDLERPAANGIFEPYMVGSHLRTMAVAGLFHATIDLNGNGTPDACECVADLTGDGAVDAADLAALIGAWGASGVADLDHDGVVSATDLALLIGMWGGC